MISINADLRIVQDRQDCKVFGSGETKCLNIRVVNNRKVRDEFVADFYTVKLWTKNPDAIQFSKGDTIGLINANIEIETYTNKDGLEVKNTIFKTFNAFIERKIPVQGSSDWGNTPANDSPFDDAPVSEGGW